MPNARRQRNTRMRRPKISFMPLNTWTPLAARRFFRASTARVSFPVQLSYDEYRLGRHVLGRWPDAALRKAFLQHAWYFTRPVIRRLRASEDVKALMPSVERYGTPAVISTLRYNDFAGVIPSLLAALSPAQETRYRALLMFAKRRMHEFITHPEPRRQPSRWEQQKVARRIRLRDVQLRSMQRSVHLLHQERKALLSRLRESRRQQHPELDVLAAEPRGSVQPGRTQPDSMPPRWLSRRKFTGKQ